LPSEEVRVFFSARRFQASTLAHSHEVLLLVM